MDKYRNGKIGLGELDCHHRQMLWTAIGQSLFYEVRQTERATVLRKNREALSSKMGDSYPPEKSEGDGK